MAAQVLQWSCACCQQTITEQDRGKEDIDLDPQGKKEDEASSSKPRIEDYIAPADWQALLAPAVPPTRPSPSSNANVREPLRSGKHEAHGNLKDDARGGRDRRPVVPVRAHGQHECWCDREEARRQEVVQVDEPSIMPVAAWDAVIGWSSEEEEEEEEEEETLSEERKGEDTVKHLRQRSGSAANAAALPLDSDQARHSKRLRQAKPGCDLFGRPLC